MDYDRQMNQRQWPVIEHLHWNEKSFVRRRLFRIRGGPTRCFQMDGMTNVLLISQTETVTSLCLLRLIRCKIPETKTIHHHPSQTTHASAKHQCLETNRHNQSKNKQMQSIKNKQTQSIIKQRNTINQKTNTLNQKINQHLVYCSRSETDPQPATQPLDE